MKTIIAGTRTATREETRRAIDECPWKHGITVVLSGVASGADQHGDDWATETGRAVSRYPANWSVHGKAAGPIRNKEMAQDADALIAVWDGKSRGTGDMIRQAKANGLRTFIWRTDLGRQQL